MMTDRNFTFVEWRTPRSIQLRAIAEVLKDTPEADEKYFSDILKKQEETSTNINKLLAFQIAIGIFFIASNLTPDISVSLLGVSIKTFKGVNELLATIWWASSNLGILWRAENLFLTDILTARVHNMTEDVAKRKLLGRRFRVELGRYPEYFTYNEKLAPPDAVEIVSQIVQASTVISLMFATLLLTFAAVCTSAYIVFTIFAHPSSFGYMQTAVQIFVATSAVLSIFHLLTTAPRPYKNFYWLDRLNRRNEGRPGLYSENVEYVANEMTRAGVSSDPSPSSLIALAFWWAVLTGKVQRFMSEWWMRIREKLIAFVRRFKP